ncbi:MAG: three-Cys-motif partner protein TcmP [Verrucomicrobia bacterium]|nr:three-Cys-motif partner protein TcmP [Verrucomicrobiota bacterium]
MGSTRKFFVRKHEWSEIKDRILGAYLRPYLAKICRTGKAVRIADCFAGKGRFDDGKDGSPIIVRQAIDEQLQHTPGASIQGVFIENKYVEDLRRNLPEDEHVHILEGDYEERMDHFIATYDARNKNLFLYVDPYGIKSLRMAHFKAVAAMPFYTAEVLINFNAHGFLREGCRLMKIAVLDGEPLQEEYEPDVNSPDNLDAIAGGDYWRPIVKTYYKTHDFHAAEDALVVNYTRELRQVFKHVIQFPIKVKLTHIARYRMIYGTNHEDGLLLMADNMNKRWCEFRDKVRPQGVLFEMDFPEMQACVTDVDVEKCILDSLDERKTLNALLVCLVDTFGVCFSTSELKDRMKKLEKDNKLGVVRLPAKNESGKAYRGWDHTGRGGYQVFVERSAQWQQNLL